MLKTLMVGPHFITLAVRYTLKNLSAFPSKSTLLWQGYLDIVRYLCESGGATAEVNGTSGVDVRSKGGWTPLSVYCISRISSILICS